MVSMCRSSILHADTEASACTRMKTFLITTAVKHPRTFGYELKYVIDLAVSWWLFCPSCMPKTNAERHEHEQNGLSKAM